MSDTHNHDAITRALLRYTGFRVTEMSLEPDTLVTMGRVAPEHAIVWRDAAIRLRLKAYQEGWPLDISKVLIVLPVNGSPEVRALWRIVFSPLEGEPTIRLQDFYAFLQSGPPNVSQQDRDVVPINNLARLAPTNLTPVR